MSLRIRPGFVYIHTYTASHTLIEGLRMTMKFVINK